MCNFEDGVFAHALEIVPFRKRKNNLSAAAEASRIFTTLDAFHFFPASCFAKFHKEAQAVSSDGSGLSRTIAVVQMHVWLSFVRFCICVLNSLNRVVESFFENFRSMTDLGSSAAI